MHHRAAWACLAVLPAMASAEQWVVLPRVGLTADTDTNRRLRVIPRQSEGLVLGGALSVARLTETTQFALVPRYSIARYSGEDAMDSNDWGIDTTWHRAGERTLVDLSAGYSDDNTLATELGETGFVDGNTRRHMATASASLSQYISVRHVLTYNVAYSDIDYLQTIGTGLVGYRYPNASISYTYTATPRIDFTLIANQARLLAGEAGIESDTSGLQAGIHYRISENFNIEARSGGTHTSSFGRSDTERSYFLGVDWRNPLSSFNFSLSRDVSPTGRGMLTNADDLNASYTRQLTEKVSFNATARASRRKDFTFDLRRNDYTYEAAGLGLSWQIDESWSLGAAAGYAHQAYEITPDTAAGKRIGLSLSWRPPT
jgi:hypothetical protein